MSKKTSPAEAYFADAKNWRKELAKLRTIALGSGLTEELKWRAPCYSLDGGGNVAMIGAFKEYCALSFFKGALLRDPAGILAKPGENTQAARLVRFTALAEITDVEATLKAYLREAAELEKAGAKVTLKNPAEFAIPEELAAKFAESPKLKAAFEALTPGRRRAYAMHFAAAKQSKTRTARIEAAMPRILAGKGMNDCVCGRSQKMPACDGSHAKPR